MHNTYLSSDRGKLLKTGASKLGITIKIAFILATVINVEIAKTGTSFLVFRTINT